VDCGLVFEKRRGSLAKLASRTGIFGSGCSDLNPTAHNKEGRDLISSVRPGISRLGVKGRTGRRRGRRSSPPAAASRRRWPDLALRAGIRVGKRSGMRLSMSNPPRVTAGLIGALCGKPTGDSRSVQLGSPASALTRRSGPKERGKRLWLHAPCKNDPESGLSGAVQIRRGVTAPE
jgi:hypothetical protein